MYILFPNFECLLRVYAFLAFLVIYLTLMMLEKPLRPFYCKTFDFALKNLKFEPS